MDKDEIEKQRRQLKRLGFTLDMMPPVRRFLSTLFLGSLHSVLDFCEYLNRREEENNEGAD